MARRKRALREEGVGKMNESGKLKKGRRKKELCVAWVLRKEKEKQREREKRVTELKQSLE